VEILPQGYHFNALEFLEGRGLVGEQQQINIRKCSLFMSVGDGSRIATDQTNRFKNIQPKTRNCLREVTEGNDMLSYSLRYRAENAILFRIYT